ncbi:HlyD family efflux transporter periplasmic adaptor subunit [Ruegeria atlantica]|uniref:HlyD family efflux transporter periplasmic adaptor subunit n=1 Tax=Ruegeria atlantica TaxID=81569 RepID=UPI00147E3F85|nr:HlyD family efflux transporter periplasmic adaptor subunit [Ruegeria atlantica]
MEFDPLKTEKKRARRDWLIIWLCLTAVVATVVWSSAAKLARVVRAEGQIVTATRTEIVQNLEGGILVSIAVEEGDQVNAGEELARLDPTQFATNVAEIEHKVSALEIRRTRLEAEARKAENFQIPAQLVEQRPNLSRSETLVFMTRQRSRQSTMERLEQRIELRSQEVSLLGPLVGTRAVSELQLLNAKLALSELVSERARFVSEQDRDIAAELSEIVAEIDLLNSTLRSRQDQLARTVVRASSSGVVHQLFFATPGAVVGPGEPILEIVPAEDRLIIEARVEPKDIGYVTSGMRATLKVTAYDYRVNGTLSGKVVRVGADTVPDPIDPRLPHAFIVSIEVDPKDEERWLGAGLELRNGLLVDAELQATETRVIDYILRPVFRAKEALAEL